MLQTGSDREEYRAPTDREGPQQLEAGRGAGAREVAREPDRVRPLERI